MKKSKTVVTLLVLALTLAMLLPASVVNADSVWNVALNKPVLWGGWFFVGGWGGGLTVDKQTITDGAFLARGTQWDQGAVWWDSHSTSGQWIVIDLLGLYEISSFVVQADNNDVYRLYYWDLAADDWQLVWDVPAIYEWGMVTRPDPSDDTVRYPLSSPILTNQLMLIGDDSNSDLWYSVSEVQAYGFGVPNYVTGGGTWDKPGVGKKVDFSLAGCVGTNEMGEIVGQFQIINHMTKTSYHSTGFTKFYCSGDEATTPTALDEVIVFTGTFRNNRNSSIITLSVCIWENYADGEGSKGEDLLAIQEGAWNGGGNFWIGHKTGSTIYLESLSTGNFQRHNI